MFYIDTYLKGSRRDVILAHALPATIVFLAFVAVTTLGYTSAQHDVQNEQDAVLRQESTIIRDGVSQRMSAYEDILRGGAGLFQASSDVTRDEWRNYLETFNIEQRYPGIQGVGYSVVLTPGELAQHTQTVRDQGFPTYNVFPGGERAIYTSIMYIEPFSGANLRAFGYDMYSEPIRQTAMNAARDTGQTAISQRVTLIQEQERSQPQPGFLMYLPLYAKGASIDTAAQRQQAIAGYIYAPFRAHDLIEKTVKTERSGYAFRIIEKGSQSREPLYQSDNYDSLDRANPATIKRYKNEVQLPGITWELEGLASPAVVSNSLRSRATTTIWGGLLLSFFIAGFIYLLLANRSHAVGEKEKARVQDAKDELLALASHQLRTPATGVKQYIGMLRQGMAGSVTPMQQGLLDKAYASNERQLSTINEILLVARADAGRLKFETQKLNISDVLSDIVEEQRQTISGRNQDVRLNLPKRPLYIKADTHYMRMALENIVSNASKYTRPGGKIDVLARSQKNCVVIKVRDNGVGVDAKDRHLLFSKFSRIPNEMTNQVTGTGIGLYLAKQIVDASDGSIQFDSVADVGTCVTISLPRPSETADTVEEKA